MYEGSADAMANDLLLYLGIRDEARHRACRERALNRCGLALLSGPVAEAAQRGTFQTFYDCGMAMALWTEAALRKVRPDADLFTFWRRLVSAARDRDGTYDQDLYFSVLEDAGVASDVTTRMRSFVSTSRTMAPVVAGLRAAGIRVTEDSVSSPAAVQRDLANRAFAHLMSAACGRANLWSGSPIKTGVIAGCSPFDSTLLITAVQGRRVADQGNALYDAVVAACASGEPVTLTAQDGTAKGPVRCTKPLAARPAWLSLPPGTLGGAGVSPGA